MILLKIIAATIILAFALNILLMIIEIFIRNNVHFQLNNNPFTIADTPCSLYTTEHKFIEKPKTKEPPIGFTGIAITKHGDFVVEKWYLNGKYHREDGPAIERTSGSREWWMNGKRHRIDGPAFEYFFGDREWWLDDKQYTEEQHKLLVDIMKLKGLL